MAKHIPNFSTASDEERWVWDRINESIRAEREGRHADHDFTVEELRRMARNAEEAAALEEFAAKNTSFFRRWLGI